MDLDLLPLRPNSEEPQMGQKLGYFVLRCEPAIFSASTGKTAKVWKIAP